MSWVFYGESSLFSACQVLLSRVEDFCRESSTFCGTGEHFLWRGEPFLSRVECFRRGSSAFVTRVEHCCRESSTFCGTDDHFLWRGEPVLSRVEYFTPMSNTFNMSLVFLARAEYFKRDSSSSCGSTSRVPSEHLLWRGDPFCRESSIMVSGRVPFTRVECVQHESSTFNAGRVLFVASRATLSRVESF